MRLVILGAGGFGRTIEDTAGQMGKYGEILFLDDDQENPIAAGSCREYAAYIDSHTEFYPAFGNNQVRLDWISRLEEAGAMLASIVHPSAYVSPTVHMEKGVAVLPRAAVNTDTRILQGAIINLGALIDHGCVIGRGAHICVGAIIKAENRIPDCMKIEAGQVIENRTF